MSHVALGEKSLPTCIDGCLNWHFGNVIGIANFYAAKNISLCMRILACQLAERS